MHELTRRSTYNAPARNRRIIIDIVLMAKADKNEKINPPSAAMRITFCLPLEVNFITVMIWQQNLNWYHYHVSARKPHKCDVNTIPRYEMALRIPCSSVVNFKSHFAYGIIYEIFVFSIAEPNTPSPVKIVRIIWYFPISAKDLWFKWVPSWCWCDDHDHSLNTVWVQKSIYGLFRLLLPMWKYHWNSS